MLFVVKMNKNYFDHGSDGELGAQVESDDVDVQHLPPLVDGPYNKIREKLSYLLNCQMHGRINHKTV